MKIFGLMLAQFQNRSEVPKPSTITGLARRRKPRLLLPQTCSSSSPPTSEPAAGSAPQHVLNLAITLHPHRLLPPLGLPATALDPQILSIASQALCKVRLLCPAGVLPPHIPCRPTDLLFLPWTCQGFVLFCFVLPPWGLCTQSSFSREYSSWASSCDLPLCNSGTAVRVAFSRLP